MRFESRLVVLGWLWTRLVCPRRLPVSQERLGPSKASGPSRKGTTHFPGWAVLSLSSCVVPQETRFFLSRRGLHRKPSPPAPSVSISFAHPRAVWLKQPWCPPVPSCPLPLWASDPRANSVHLSSISIHLSPRKEIFPGIDLGVRIPGFKSCLCHFLAPRTWENYLTYLCLIYKVGNRRSKC